MLNPITYTERVVDDFLRYQMTTYAFADRDLRAQMRQLLSLEETRSTPLLKGPYFSLSRAFRQGASFTELAQEGTLHPHLVQVAREAKITHAYGHQASAFRAIAAGKTTVISTGTGSGKTESFLYPIISRCLHLRDANAPAGISAVLVYPMNALAEDQLGRLRALLAGTGVTFGMYVGKTPERKTDVTGERLDSGASNAAYKARVEDLRARADNRPVHPAEERVSREEMRTAGLQPRILLTNVKQLELLLTRQQDAELFANARLDFLVFDEAHTFTGAMGAETACLIRRLRTYCGKSPDQTVGIATSATIADPVHGAEAGRLFAHRFFGVQASDVCLVGEDYEADDWAPTRSPPPALAGSAAVQLQTVMQCLDQLDHCESVPQAARAHLASLQVLTGVRLEATRWREALYDALAANEVAYQLAQALDKPKTLQALLADLRERLGRDVPEEEVLIWLALGAASRRGDRPLLRPVVHGFIRGVDGAVVTFPAAERGPKLWLSAKAAEAESEGLHRLPVLTCTSCGQHYYEHFAEDFSFTGRTPAGGAAVGDDRFWQALPASDVAGRVLLVDRLAESDADDDPAEDTPETPPRRTAPLYLCRYCGGLHPQPATACLGCGRPTPLVLLHAVQQRENRKGRLSACIRCSAIGHDVQGRFREPSKPVRATTVADVHVLAQNMLHYAERKRLLVFADNRQDAAFQAGWMRDHARRYRLRGLIMEQLRRAPMSVGDLVTALDHELNADDDQSQTLLPEVWAVHRKEAAGRAHHDERRKFLRILVLKELTVGNRQSIGLEPWGRLRVEYQGLREPHPFFGEWANKFGRTEEDLMAWVESLLDTHRRARILLDRELRLFSRYFKYDDPLRMDGYLAEDNTPPKGIKVQRSEHDSSLHVAQWMSPKGVTTARQLLSKLTDGAPGDAEAFFLGLWELVVNDRKILAPVQLETGAGRPLPAAGAVQIDADRLILVEQRCIWRCTTCRRGHPRRPARALCTGWNCKGEVRSEAEDTDNYDLRVLDERFAMMRPREHSAQVPPKQREQLERTFKDEASQHVNALVATPTLELGVDIGSLDSVLMRNVPPGPANYWQRAGRAGRRHRMAVNLTYARAHSHDRAYFEEPDKLLLGLISPPSFNLKNELMVRKHAHAVMLSVLRRLARSTALSGSARQGVQLALSACFPRHVKDYLFEANGNLRTTDFDVTPLKNVVADHRAELLDELTRVFRTSWPQDDQEAVRDEALARAVDGMADELRDVTAALRRRLNWATRQLDRLDKVRRAKGTLEPDEDALRRRCDELIKRLKGVAKRARQDSEGIDDTETFGVLALEGFLPGYGLDVGSIQATHLAPQRGNLVDARTWSLRRNISMAVREYSPGNLIYANNHRYTPRHFHFDLTEPLLFDVDVANEAIHEVGSAGPDVTASLSATSIAAMAVCDVDLTHISAISDEEDFRFQLSVSVLGHEKDRHGEGELFTWGGRSLSFRHNVHLRLVNVGVASMVRQGQLGYPVCRVCGASRSPFGSRAELTKFADWHIENHQVPAVTVPAANGQTERLVAPLGFYSDIVSDCLTLQGCAERSEAYSVLEALRLGAAEVLEMEVEDLQVLVVGRPGTSFVDAMLYDPMPGGSGLLQQMLRRWPEVHARAKALVDECAGACATSCIDCLQHFRNAFYHTHLDRVVAAERLAAWGDGLVHNHSIPAKMPTAPESEGPRGEPERVLQHLLERAGLGGGIHDHRIELGNRYGATIPDLFYEISSGHRKGICIYLDGMSRGLHGDPARRQADEWIRDELNSLGYVVLALTVVSMQDRDMMRNFVLRLARWLNTTESVESVVNRDEWFSTR